MPNALSRLLPWLTPARRTAPLPAALSMPAREEKASRTGAIIAIDNLRRPVWTPRDYAAFAREGYMQNAIVYRSVRMVAEAAASIPILLYEGGDEIDSHPLRDLIARPAPMQTGTDFFEAWFGSLLVSGNAYAEAVASDDGEVRELHVLRSDRVKVIPDMDGWPEAYEYTVNGRSVRFSGDVVEGVTHILHLKLFHPANDHYGMSPLEAAATAVDIHNTAAQWNKALLDNSARPSGALVYTGGEGRLTAEQFERLRDELEQGFQGARQAGRPLLLEGGLDWKALGLTPKDMDFIEAKNAAAREIALALGVPPMLLGIPGDNTYSNYQEAQRAFWRQTVLPLFTRTAKAMSAWLSPAWPGDVELRADLDQIEALTIEREALWVRLQATSFLTDDEKRAAIGYGPLPVEVQAPQPDFDTAAPDDGRFNPYHDEMGRFTDAEGNVGGAGGVGRGGGVIGQATARDGIRVAGRGGAALKYLLRLLKPAPKPKLDDLMKAKGRKGKLDGEIDGLEQEEKEFIEEMLDLGNDMKVVPRGSKRTPDFEINGVTVERKNLSGVKKTDSNGISAAISSRTMDARGQSSHVIIDARKQTGISKEIAERGIERAFGADKKHTLEEMIVLTPDGSVARRRP